MTLDGGFIYIAGQCGLVPVLGENYGKQWAALLCAFVSLPHGQEGTEIRK